MLSVIFNPKNTTLPGVCSPVDAGEVARRACRRGGDLPRGLHCVQNDTNKVCHVERKRNIPWKGKTCGLDVIRNIQSEKYHPSGRFFGRASE